MRAAVKEVPILETAALISMRCSRLNDVRRLQKRPPVKRVVRVSNTTVVRAIICKVMKRVVPDQEEEGACPSLQVALTCRSANLCARVQSASLLRARR